MISSFFSGRVRVRHEALKNRETLRMVLDILAKRDGITRAEPNPVTGSLLVIYDPAVISRAELTETAKMLEEKFAARFS
ncbi:MAG: hypothetical protein LBU39_02505 [Desulfobulbaceae bacterium]|jgi:hypothetical protein|nr:hypothetical protein [Desulfobulbaceae bacterium]